MVHVSHCGDIFKYPTNWTVQSLELKQKLDRIDAEFMSSQVKRLGLTPFTSDLTKLKEFENIFGPIQKKPHIDASVGCVDGEIGMEREMQSLRKLLLCHPTEPYEAVF